ncbi:hypothetical protein [Chitinophaga dinghuensis]|uniref:hypothetical protein n=1 Tax=Chitinophaga dinghuensis TaxID=1539050 RepID=UPI000DB9A854|nr:hypothetical protein [Chitinophaga dinghuensis]
MIATAILLLVIVSIYVYIRTRLELSDQEIMYFDGMKPVYVKWSNVVAIDMKMKGKYSELEVFVYYDNRRFTLDATHFGKKQLKRILELLEMKVDQSLFSPSYQQLRAERLPRSVASK